MLPRGGLVHLLPRECPLGCRYVDYLYHWVFLDRIGHPAVVRLRASWSGIESGDPFQAQPAQGRCWEGLSDHQKGPFKDAACHLGYLGPVLELNGILPVQVPVLNDSWKRAFHEFRVYLTHIADHPLRPETSQSKDMHKRWPLL